MTIHETIAASPSPRLRGEGRGEGRQPTPTSEQAAAPHPNPLPMPEEAWGEGMPMIPHTAPFSVEQRAWLNGFFAGMLSLDAQVAPLTGELPGAAAKALAGGDSDDGAPWHDVALPIDERMQLAEGRPLPRRLFAAMAQQDCGQCGYLCETYSAAIASGAESKLNLCVPGGKETSRMLKRLLEETPAPAAPAAPAIAKAAQPIDGAASRGRSRDDP